MQGQTNVPSELTNAIGIAAGYYHSLALKSDGAVVVWETIRMVKRICRGT
ncbi:MAG TPA: RCC1 domain-containing protein [Candidatus Paceibacterota bacterium]|nr:RCC1 domain-containing protein [Verrucomicrobiota bacterium]HRY51216.1 RCC1 domain-containing protein [Candidatus Paceibacterota bacterium]HSA00165.1 RCC1 domain-containing protein [Candidatus Paceibacterota bacterium]